MNRQEELLPDPDAPRNVPLSNAGRDSVRQAGLEALAAMLDPTVAEIEAEPKRFQALVGGERLKAVRLSKKSASAVATESATMSTDDARLATWRYLRKHGFSIVKTRELDAVQTGELLNALGERTDAQPGWDWPVIIAALKTNVVVS